MYKRWYKKNATYIVWYKKKDDYMNTEKFYVSQCYAIVEKIESYMIENNLKAHEKLPGERKLCELWECNRVTLRSAFAYLEKEGKTYSIQGMGNFIAPPKAEISLTEFQSFYEQMSGAGYDLHNELIYIRQKEASEKEAEKLGIHHKEIIYEVQTLLHANDTAVILETSILPAKQYKNLEDADFVNKTIYEILAQTYKIEIKHGTEEIAITNAEPLEAELFEIEDNAPLFYVKKKGCVDGKTVVFSNSVVRPDKVKFSSVLR